MGQMAQANLPQVRQESFRQTVVVALCVRNR